MCPRRTVPRKVNQRLSKDLMHISVLARPYKLVNNVFSLSLTEVFVLLLCSQYLYLGNIEPIKLLIWLWVAGP